MTLLVSTVGVRSAEACSCFANPPCAAVWKADAVFVGTVVDRVQEPVGGSISWTVHKVAVDQRLHGAIDTLVTLVPGNRPSAEQIAASKSHGALWVGSTCDFEFDAGRRYLIYARRTADGRWTTSICSGTKPVDEAAEDLEYLATIPTAQPTGRVYGTIERTIVDPLDRTTWKTVPATGVTLSLANDSNRLTVKADAQGRVDVQVPPGEYSIAPVVPETVRVYGGPPQASVPARGCTPISFSLYSNGRIEGRVVHEDGTPVPWVSVSMIPADFPKDRRPESSTIAPGDSTNESGRFAIDAILPGRYVLAINARLGPTLSKPYAATYYPGVARDRTEPIDIADGERKTGFTIVVRPLAATTVSGVVLFEDNRPAANARVTVWTVDQGNLLSHADTDHTGAFKLPVLTGLAYNIRATLRAEAGEHRAEATVFVDQEKEGVRLSIRR